MELSMKVSVIANLMTFPHRSINELRPALGMRAKDEKRGLNFMFAELVENSGSSVRIGTVIERECHIVGFFRKMCEHTAEKAAVSMKCAVRGAGSCKSQQRSSEDHIGTGLPPSTLE